MQNWKFLLGAATFITVFSTSLFPSDEGLAAKTEIYSFESVTLTDQQFLTGATNGKSVVIAGELRLPPGTGKFPAVILIHGSAGIGANIHLWAGELNRIGVATFIVDSFTGRGIVQTVTDQSQLGTLAMIGDAYGALTLLSKHGRIDSSKIALMGTSKGGDVALHASIKRFQHMYGPAGVEFAAYISLYAPCNTTYLEGDDVSKRPIRMFHGAADNWVPVTSCRDYVKRLQDLGRDVQFIEYAGANHGFDNPLNTVHENPDAQVRARRCQLEERQPGVIVNRETDQPFTFHDPCIDRGARVGYDAHATEETIKAVKQFLTSLWSLGGA